jgi:hypothetical protein
MRLTPDLHPPLRGWALSSSYGSWLIVFVVFLCFRAYRLLLFMLSEFSSLSSRLSELSSSALSRNGTDIFLGGGFLLPSGELRFYSGGI